MENLNIEDLKKALNNNIGSNIQDNSNNNYEKLIKSLTIIFFNLFTICLLVCSFYTYFANIRNIWVYILWAYTLNTIINKITLQINQ